MIDLGTVRPGSTIRIPFSSFDKDDGSSITMTNFAAADILVYKDGGTTERASTAGFTATTDFDSKTGKHVIVLDLSDDTTADFWKAGSEYLVAIDAVTVDTVTTGGWVARFRIGYPNAYLDTSIATLASQTSFTLTTGPAEDDALNGMVLLIHDKASAVQVTRVVVEDYTGSTKTVTLRAAPATTFVVAAGDNVSAVGYDTANVTHFGGTAQTARDIGARIDDYLSNVSTPLSTSLVAALRSNTAQAGAASSITLDASASSVTDFYVGLYVYLFSNTGVGQARLITAYNGTTKVATVDRSWATNPDNTTGFRLYPAVALDSILSRIGVAGAGLTSIPDSAGVSTLLTRLSATRAGYLDNLSAGAVALASAVATAQADLTTLVGRLTALRAAALDEVTSARMATLTDWIDGGRLDAILDTVNAAVAAAAIRAALGLSAANLDTQLATIAGYIDTEVAAILAAVDTEVAAIKAVTDLLPNGGALTSLATAAALAAVAADLPHRYTRAVAVTGFTFFMRDSTNHQAATGLTVTAQRTLDGAALASCANAVAEIGNGLYKINLDSTDMDAVTVALRFTASGADDLVIILPTQPT